MRTGPLASSIAVVTLVLGLSTAACSSSSVRSPASTSKETFCALLIAFRVSNDSLQTDVTSGDAATTQTAVKRLVGQATTLQQRAPSDISSDVGVVKTFVDALDGLFAKYGYDLTKLSADPAAVEQYATLNSDAVQSSLAQLRAYGDQDCSETTSTTSGETSTTGPGETSTTTAGGAATIVAP